MPNINVLLQPSEGGFSDLQHLDTDPNANANTDYGLDPYLDPNIVFESLCKGSFFMIIYNQFLKMYLGSGSIAG